MRYDDFERARREIVQAAYLKKKTLSFCCLLVDLKPPDFNGYTERRLNHRHWK